VKKAIFWALPVLTLAACGGGETENKTKARAAGLTPGQYEVTAEVTQFRKADEGTPKINTPQGTRTTRSVCVTDGAKLPPDLFADEGFACENAGNAFASGGTLNLNLRCRRPGLSGSVGYSVSGSFEEDSFEVDRQLATQLSTDGDVVVSSRVQGRRTGECTPAPAGNSAAAKGANK
jgi:hypothetical protein